MNPCTTLACPGHAVEIAFGGLTRWVCRGSEAVGGAKACGVWSNRRWGRRILSRMGQGSRRLRREDLLAGALWQEKPASQPALAPILNMCPTSPPITPDRRLPPWTAYSGKRPQNQGDDLCAGSQKETVKPTGCVASGPTLSSAITEGGLLWRPWWDVRSPNLPP